MSLNGLDAAVVQEAYQQASHEAGGWFLLHYTSRDLVELLARGKGGVHEARAAIAKYTESSPLYGLIFYRRRKFLIKYIPEGTSRLLQARTAVHFQDITERYAPYETLLEITTADALNDTSLAASFSLHTAASPSVSSSRLHEISEDAEDGPTPRRPSNSNSATGTIFGTQRYKLEKRVDQIMGSGTPQRSPSSLQVQTDRSARLSTASSRTASLSPIKTSVSNVLARGDGRQHSLTSLSSTTKSPISEDAASEVSLRNSESSDVTSTDAGKVDPVDAMSIEPLSRPATSNTIPDKSASIASASVNELPRVSLSTERTSTDTLGTERRKVDDDPYDFSKYDFVPKVKLGPRPVTSEERTKRPTVASISSVPATYRPTGRKQETARPRSIASQASSVTSSGAVAVPPIPLAPEYTPRPISRGSIKSTQTSKSAMTAERLRLMKAVELRKRQLRRSTPKLQGVNVGSMKADAPPVPAPPQENKADLNASSEEVREEDPTAADSPVPDLGEQSQVSAKKPDSGIAMDYSRAEGSAESSDLTAMPVIEPDANAQETAHVSDESDHAGLAEDAAEASPEIAGPTAESSEETLPLAGSADQTPTLVAPHTEEVEVPAAAPAALEPSNTFGEKHERDIDSSVEATSDRDDDSLHLADQPTLDALHRGIREGLGIQAAEDDGEGTTVPIILMADGTRPVSALLPGKTIPADQASISSQQSDMQEPFNSPRRQNSDLARRRRGFVEPLSIGEESLGSDDELLESLQSATFQEAKPVTVPKSPIGQNFVRRPSGSSLHSLGSVKSVTISPKPSQVSEDRSPEIMVQVTPEPELAPPIAAAFDSNESLQGKRSVSAGISRRIQTLTEASSREAPTFLASQSISPRPLTPDAYPGDFRAKDRQRPIKSPVGQSRTLSYQKQLGRPNALPPAQAKTQASDSATSPDRQMIRNPTAPESVTVTARIVRSNTAPRLDDGSEKLQQPELVMNYKRASIQHDSLPSTLAMMGPPESETGNSSTPPSRSAHRKSWSRRNQSISPSAEDFPSPPSNAVPAPAGNRTSFMLWDDEPMVAPKEGSRTSRFFKRMSHLGSSNRRRSVMQQGPSTRDLSPAGTKSAGPLVETPPAIVVGDLNIQFPDTLLWKRRIVEVDSKGFLTFAIPLAMDIQKHSAKKYHISDFAVPYAPDLDRQELPNSIMLDSLDGNTTLQAACEDSLSHRQVLNTLRSHWKAWNAVGR